ncbi:hypothetical protein C0081_21875 [Cohaesibacter celericrescens]|uniref:Uncharacterized protein n=1 Tax=Cohaesibacter celericrescens TaxID=2067669 RepID=A0A2N5XKF0_9HYPH|nr:hypothetical protein C0081_21875 [Cohaesibacter celericrescens]
MCATVLVQADLICWDNKAIVQADVKAGRMGKGQEVYRNTRHLPQLCYKSGQVWVVANGVSS